MARVCLAVPGRNPGKTRVSDKLAQPEKDRKKPRARVEPRQCDRCLAVLTMGIAKRRVKPAREVQPACNRARSEDEPEAHAKSPASERIGDITCRSCCQRRPDTEPTRINAHKKRRFVRKVLLDPAADQGARDGDA